MAKTLRVTHLLKQTLLLRFDVFLFSPVPLMHRLILLLLNTQRNTRHLSSSFLTILALLLTFFSVSPSVAQSTNATKHTLSVHLKGVNDNKGNIVLSVYDSPEHFRKHPLHIDLNFILITQFHNKTPQKLDFFCLTFGVQFIHQCFFSLL